LEGGIRKADALVNEIAPALSETEDMRAGVEGLLKHGPRGMLDNIVFHGR
jgi:hypothetical protein